MGGDLGHGGRWLKPAAAGGQRCWTERPHMVPQVPPAPMSRRTQTRSERLLPSTSGGSGSICERHLSKAGCTSCPYRREAGGSGSAERPTCTVRLYVPLLNVCNTMGL